MKKTPPAATSAVLERYRNNRHANWNRSPSRELSTNADDASPRIFEGYATVVPEQPPRRFTLGDPVFAMGSCFARELEGALLRMDGNVVSRDKTIEDPVFWDSRRQKFRRGYFHRFTPRSMLQEFQWCFDELDGWAEDTLLFQERSDTYLDCQYWPIREIDMSLEASRRRRKIARALVRKVIDAKLVILTLGLTESWTHLPTGFSLNRADPKLLLKRPDEFAFQRIGLDEALSCLNGMRELVMRHNANDPHFVVTVSPVPLAATFTGQDIITANMDSKATLRAASGSFADQHANVSYFPAYEMVQYSAHASAWRQDRLHVQTGMVEHVMSTFTRAYFTP